MAKGGGKGLSIVGLATELGFIIALPLLALVVAGHWLDLKLGTKVAFTIFGMVIALSLSSYAIYLKIKKITDV